MVNKIPSDDSAPKVRAIAPSNQENSESKTSIEGATFNGASIVSSPQFTKTSKRKKIVAILLDKFHYLRGKAEFTLGIGLTLIDQGRAVNEIAKVFFEPCVVLDKILTPLRFLQFTSVPFFVYNSISHGVDFFTTPSWGKILPVMNSIVDVGIAAEMAANTAHLLEAVGIVAVQNIAVWTTPLYGVALGLQSVAIAINGWGFAEVSNSIRKLNKAVKENVPGEAYSKAVDMLTKKPETTLEKVRSKFFKVLSGKQDARILRIHEKVKAGQLQESDMKEALMSVKHRFHFKQFAYTLAIVAAVAGIIGVAILVFAPTPIAPIGWMFIGLSATTTLAMVGVNIYASKRLSSALKEIDPEPLPGEKPPFYKRTYKWIRTKLKKHADGTTTQEQSST